MKPPDPQTKYSCRSPVFEKVAAHHSSLQECLESGGGVGQRGGEEVGGVEYTTKFRLFSSGSMEEEARVRRCRRIRHVRDSISRMHSIRCWRILRYLVRLASWLTRVAFVAGRRARVSVCVRVCTPSTCRGGTGELDSI